MNNSLEWGAPVLYLRVQDGRLFDLPAFPRQQTGPIVQPPPLTPLRSPLASKPPVPLETLAAPAGKEPAAKPTPVPQGVVLPPAPQPAPAAQGTPQGAAQRPELAKVTPEAQTIQKGEKTEKTQPETPPSPSPVAQAPSVQPASEASVSVPGGAIRQSLATRPARQLAPTLAQQSTLVSTTPGAQTPQAIEKPAEAQRRLRRFVLPTRHQWPILIIGTLVGLIIAGVFGFGGDLHSWESHFGRHDFVFGQLGENFTVDGLSDEEVCIGDHYRIGRALFEVTQPRVTCYRVGIRMNEPQMAALLVSHRRPGFYFRVLHEGEVEAGDEIVKVADGAERMTVAEIDAMLYLGQHTREQLERALRLPALSPGWRTSFQALLEQAQTRETVGGNPGLAPASGPPPAWQGFRPLQVSRMERESRSIVSLILVPADGHPLAAALPGQFVVLRLRPRPEATLLLRNYSLSDAPSTDHYRVSVKQEVNGAASTYVHTQVQVGRGTRGECATGHLHAPPGPEPRRAAHCWGGSHPVLAMLHALAAEASPRDVWWLFGARNRHRTPVCAGSTPSPPEPCPTAAATFSTVGQVQRTGQDGTLMLLDTSRWRCSRSLACHARRTSICVDRPSFLHDVTSGLAAWGVDQGACPYRVFGPASPSSTPAWLTRHRSFPPHLPAESPGTGPLVSFARSGLVVHWNPGFGRLLELAEACAVPVPVVVPDGGLP